MQKIDLCVSAGKFMTDVKSVRLRVFYSPDFMWMTLIPVCVRSGLQTDPPTDTSTNKNRRRIKKRTRVQKTLALW